MDTTTQHQGEYAVLASNGGSAAPRHWYYNLKQHPHVELQGGGTKKDYLAREAARAERAIRWERAVAVWPDFGRYAMELDRTTPVFVLRPVGAAR